MDASKKFISAGRPGPRSRKDVVIPPYVKAIGGSSGGLVEACCLQPVDVIKTRLQLDRTGQYKGILNCGKSIAEHEGVRALWKGLTPYAAHLTLKHSLRMGSNAVLQVALRDPKTGELSPVGRLAAGFGAGVLEAVLVVTPLEVCHHRLYLFMLFSSPISFLIERLLGLSTNKHYSS